MTLVGQYQLRKSKTDFRVRSHEIKLSRLACVLFRVEIVLPPITIKTEPLSDATENCDPLSHTSDPPNNGTEEDDVQCAAGDKGWKGTIETSTHHRGLPTSPISHFTEEVFTVDTAALQRGAESDAANLRLWSPNGLFPKFSSYVQPLLHGASMIEQRHRALSCALRDEIIQFLNEHKLIQHTNTSVMRWEYCALGRSLAARYPNMVWDHPKPGTRLPYRQKNAWSVFIRRLTASRKALKWRRKMKLMNSFRIPQGSTSTSAIRTPTTTAS
ncbi:uncharacterized protein [Dermacentor albipictus]|uniref:uncharacterized protein n=1 Tax=Dermacentor albipictus TaxID=60249 RepID=UPI0038FC4CEC